MKNNQAIKFKTKGLSSNSKHLPQLDPTFFGVDERTLSDLLRFIMDYSKQVKFTDFDNRTDKKWSSFFENNISFLIASIHTVDVEAIDAEYRSIVARLESDKIDLKKEQLLAQLLELGFSLYQKIDTWFKASKNDQLHLEENELYSNLKGVIKYKLRAQLNQLHTAYNRFKKEIEDVSSIRLDFSDFDHSWDFQKVEIDEEYVGEILTNHFNVVVKEISEYYKSAFQAILGLKEKSSFFLSTVLEQYPYQSPHISLLISFLKIFQEVQGDVNKITQKHLDYFYFEVLGQNLRSSESDHVHLYFEPSEHISKTTVTSQTDVVAGIYEDGKDHLYTTDFDVEVTNARIADVKSIHVAQNPLVGVGSNYNVVSNIYASSVNLSEGGEPLDKFGNQAAFNAFGQDQLHLSEQFRDMTQARVGWAISSPILLLKEGERKINILYKFDISSLSSLVSFIEEMVEAENLSVENAFYKLLNNVFDVRLTTSDGWFETENYELVPPDNWMKGEIQIAITLKVADAAIVGYDPTIHAGSYETKWPIVEFVLSSKKSMYSYSYFKDLRIDEYKIEVDVKNVKDLHVFNDLGKIDVSKPFTPFGATVDKGSYFLIGNEELFKKNIDQLDFNIHWHKLPRLKGGFTAHYKEYDADVKNESFTLGVTCLSDYEFYPKDESRIQQLSIFDFNTKKEELEELSFLEKVQLDKLELKPHYGHVDFDNYTSSVKSGFLKLELTGPEIGFGHAEYPRLFSEAIIENSKTSFNLLSAKEGEKKELPKEPYNPQIRSMSINYKASTKYIFNHNKVSENDTTSDEKCFHLHPFGLKETFKGGIPVSNRLLPVYLDKGYFFIGLENVQPPMEVSLYFELIDNIQNEINEAIIPTIKWKYLVNNDWVHFDKKDVIFDTTNSFTTSGIVRLKLPIDINEEHDMFPNGKFWISASVEKNTEILSKVLFLKPNGVRASWKKPDDEKEWETQLSENSISSFLYTRSEIKSVFQPYPSFGGRQKESLNEFYSRVSERLKHKNRGISSDDLERLILQEYPKLFQVRCLNHFSHPDFINRGQVKVVVVPKILQYADFVEPKVDYNELYTIQQFISSKVSPFATVEVINPVYERVKVSCVVKFQGGTNSGELVKQLESDLRKFICPWFDHDQSNMNFGGWVERDDVQTYIESLPYVQFLTKLSVIILHFNEGEYSISDSAKNNGEVNRLNSSAPWSILSVVPHHHIETIKKDQHDSPLETRIESMTIGSDFVITDEDDSVDFPEFNHEEGSYFSIEIDI